jgi:hypothetical protein
MIKAAENVLQFFTIVVAFPAQHNFPYRAHENLTNAIPSHRLLAFNMTNATLFASIRLKSISINLDS